MGKQCGSGETSCPAGCCPEANWFCCPDNMYCAATAADCPFVAKKAQLMKMAKSRQCGSGETSCPAGCCPEANWFCCPDNMYCAATAADCPFVAKKAQLMKMAKSKQCGSGETSCPAGRCPEANWHCCRLPLRCQEGPAHEVGQEQAVRIWRDLMPSWMLPRGQLVLLPRQHVLCCHCCRLPLRCQEGPAHEVGQAQAVRIWRDFMPRWLLPRGQLVLLP